MIVVMVGFPISETMIAIAQQNGNSSRNNTTGALDSISTKLDSDSKNNIIIWLESNKTNANGAPIVSISNEDFWKTFGPLFEILTNKTSGIPQ
jgi:hypothetical protein